jgi:hypothetical protein
LIISIEASYAHLFRHISNWDRQGRLRLFCSRDDTDKTPAIFEQVIEIQPIVIAALSIESDGKPSFLGDFPGRDKLSQKWSLESEPLWGCSC